MQAWYAHAFHTPGAETKPYRLYALSNLASMIALLSYPVVIEPFFAVGVQALGWSAGYLLFALSAIATGVVVYRKKVRATLQTQTTEHPQHGQVCVNVYSGLASPPQPQYCC